MVKLLEVMHECGVHYIGFLQLLPTAFQKKFDS